MLLLIFVRRLIGMVFALMTCSSSRYCSIPEGGPRPEAGSRDFCREAGEGLLLVTGGQGQGHCSHQGTSPAASSRRCVRYHLSLSSTSDQTHRAARCGAKADERLWAAQGQSGSWQRGCPGFASRSVEAHRWNCTDMNYHRRYCSKRQIVLSLSLSPRGNYYFSAQRLMRYNRPYHCWSEGLAMRRFGLCFASTALFTLLKAGLQQTSTRFCHPDRGHSRQLR